MADDEFKQLFEQEAQMQLTRLAENVLQLEAGGDPELVQQLFRDAHSVKGASAMVGFPDVSRVAHVLEDVLDQLRTGKRQPEPALADVVLKAVDDLREIIAAGMRGEDATTHADAAESAIRDFSKAAPAPITPVRIESTPEPLLEAPSAPVAEIESIAVPVARLDELVRLVNESSAALLRVGAFIENRLGEDSARAAEFRELTRVLGALQEETMRARMVSVGTIAAPLRRAVRDAARATAKQARWEIAGEQTQLDRHVLEKLRDPLMHLVRNSVDHGLEHPEVRVEAGKPVEGTVRLTATQAGSEVALVISDDGGGIDVDRLRAKAGDPSLADEDALELIFQPGVSTAEAVTDLSGRGVGLDVVRDALGGIRGRIDVRTNPGHGTEFHIRVPMTLAALHSLLLSAGGGRYAIPLQSVVTVLDPRGDERTVKLGDDLVPLSSLAETLGFPGGRESGPAVVLESEMGLHAFRVDDLVGQRAVVVKELGDVVPRLGLVAGASIEPDGSVMLVLDAPALVERAARAHPSPTPRPSTRTTHGRVLVVDDTTAIRELERAILERAGYEVVTAADGKEALVRIAERPPDIVLTDVEMPDLDGLQLVQAIRATPRIAGIPVVLVTTLASDDDRLRGLAAGADAYLVKSEFDEAELVATVERLLSG